MLCGGRNGHYTAKKGDEPALYLLPLWLLGLLGSSLLSCKITVLVIKFVLSNP